MGKNFRETLNEQMKNPEFRKEWDALEPERQITRAMLEGRQINHFTQEQLAEATGINQANISRLENGTANPSLRTLKRLAAGMGDGIETGICSHCPGGKLLNRKRNRQQFFWQRKSCCFSLPFCTRLNWNF